MLGGKPLIERNTIVYIRSPYRLRLCHISMTVEAKISSHPLISRIFNKLDEDPAAVKSFSDLRETLNATVTTSEPSSKSTFRESSPGSNIIHVHDMLVSMSTIRFGIN